MRPEAHVTTAAPRRRPLLHLLLACVLVLAACAGGTGGEDADDDATAGDDPSSGTDRSSGTDPGASTDPTAGPMSADVSGPDTGVPSPAAVGDVPARVLEPVLAAASERTGATVDEIVVRRAQGVTFSDGSLDCPVPGREYTQALVDGWWVVVAVDGEVLDYRLADGGRPRLCEGGGTTPRPRQDT